MIHTIQVPNDVIDEILDDVIRTMKRRGPPVIRAVRLNPTGWIAIEGSHRVLAAKTLGLPVIIKPMDPSQRVRHDIRIAGNMSQRTTVGKLLDVLCENQPTRRWHQVEVLIKA